MEKTKSSGITARPAPLRVGRRCRALPDVSFCQSASMHLPQSRVSLSTDQTLIRQRRVLDGASLERSPSFCSRLLPQLYRSTSMPLSVVASHTYAAISQHLQLVGISMSLTRPCSPNHIPLGYPVPKFYAVLLFASCPASTPLDLYWLPNSSG